MSMDPSGTHRIVTQQIREWHAIVDGERQAGLVEPRTPSLVRAMAGAGRRVIAAARQGGVGARAAWLAVRRRRSARSLL
jgi:hypothetical protein